MLTVLKRHQHTKPADGTMGFITIPIFVSCCFFLSGSAGLIYEVLWVRLIDKVIGSAPFAVATVLSVFMAGLALGSYLAGRTIDRFSSRAALLALYGKIEMGVGAYAVVLPFLIAAAKPFYGLIYDPLLNRFWCYQAVAFLGCVLLLIVPAALMGATLPVLCRFYVTHMGHLGSRTGWLYGLNTLGAAVGAVLCGFVLVRSLGVWATLGVAAAVNLLVGASCLLLSRQNGPVLSDHTVRFGNEFSRSGARPLNGCSGDTIHNKRMKWGLWLFAVSGFCALAYEVLWTRLLGLIVGPTTYSFTLVIATFIIGLALGSIIFGRLADRTQRVFLLLILTQLGASVTALAVSQVLGNSQFFFAKLIHTFQNSFTTLILIKSIVLFGVLLGPTLFLGAAFPLVTRLYVHSMNDLGKSLGTAYALNTVGAIIGSFAAGFLLIPLIGKENGLRLVITVQFAMALLAWILAGSSFQRRNIGLFAGAGLLFFYILLILKFPAWPGDLLSRGWYRDFGAIENDLDRTGWGSALWKGPERLGKQRQGLEVVFYGEGIGGFTTVEKEITSLGNVEYAMYNSGKADASTHGDRSTQTLSAHIPMLFHPRAQNIMVLGLASGMTPGEVLLYPVKKLDIVEINEQVVKACRSFFTPWNNNCLEDPRTRLIVQDGRNHLALTHQKYDVIISEPSNPWMAGLANLYSLEFFQMVRERLNKGGLFAQWIQSYEINWDTFSLLGRTFTEVFPKSALVKIGPVDYLLLGFMNGKGFDWQIAQKNLIYARKSKNVTFPGVNFLVHLILTEDLKALFGPGLLHTDNRPHLEFSAPMKLFSGNINLDSLVSGRHRFSPHTLKILQANSDTDTLLDLIEFSASANVPLFKVVRLDYLDPEQKDRYKNAVMGYCSQVQVPSYDIFKDSEMKVCCAELQIDKIRQRLLYEGSRSIDHYNLGLSLVAAGLNDEAAREFGTTIRLDPWHEGAHTALGLLLAQTGRLDEAVRCFSRVLEMAPHKATCYKYLGMVKLRQNEPAQAVRNLSKALQLHSLDPLIFNELGLAYLKQGNYEKAIHSFTQALTQSPRNAESHHNLAVAYYRLKDLEKAREHFLAALQIDPANAHTRYNLAKIEKQISLGKSASVKP
jgi:spermidine synthase